MLSTGKTSYGYRTLLVIAATVWAMSLHGLAQESQTLPPRADEPASADKAEQLQQTVSDLQAQVAMLKEQMKEMQAAMAGAKSPALSGPAYELHIAPLTFSPEAARRLRSQVRLLKRPNPASWKHRRISRLFPPKIAAFSTFSRAQARMSW